MLSRKTRRLVLTVHVIVAVGWLGLDIGLLTLGITGLTTSDPDLLRASYLAMDRLVPIVVLPIAATAFATGLVLALGTKWGLVRYYWVLVKFGLTAIALTASILSLRSEVHEAATLATTSQADTPDIGEVAASVVIAPSVALCIYVTATVLSIYKPWGRTPWIGSGRGSTTTRTRTGELHRR